MPELWFPRTPYFSAARWVGGLGSFISGYTRVAEAAPMSDDRLRPGRSQNGHQPLAGRDRAPQEKRCGCQGERYRGGDPQGEEGRFLLSPRSLRGTGGEPREKPGY